jgi:hypothetical protein
MQPAEAVGLAGPRPTQLKDLIAVRRSMSKLRDQAALVVDRRFCLLGTCDDSASLPREIIRHRSSST